jgi:subtilase family serine protease
MNTLLDAADIDLGATGMAAIAAGASESGTITVTIPQSTGVGTYYVIAQADSEAAVAETSETNNVRVGWIRVGPP